MPRWMYDELEKEVCVVSITVVVVVVVVVY